MDAIAEEKTSTTTRNDDAKESINLLPPPLPPHLSTDAKNDDTKSNLNNGKKGDQKSAVKDSIDHHHHISTRKEGKGVPTPTTPIPPYTEEDSSEDYGEIEPSILFDYHRGGTGHDVATPLSLPKHSNRGDDDRMSILSPPTHDLQDRDVVGRYVEVMDDGGITPMKHIPPSVDDHPETDRTHMEDSEMSEDYGSIQPSILFDPGCGVGLDDVSGVDDAGGVVVSNMAHIPEVDHEDNDDERQEGQEQGQYAGMKEIIEEGQNSEEEGQNEEGQKEEEEDNELNVSSASSHAFSTDQSSVRSLQPSVLADDHHHHQSQPSPTTSTEQIPSQSSLPLPPQSQSQEQNMTTSMVHIDTHHRDDVGEPINSTDVDDTRLTAQGNQPSI